MRAPRQDHARPRQMRNRRRAHQDAVELRVGAGLEARKGIGAHGRRGVFGAAAIGVEHDRLMAERAEVLQMALPDRAGADDGKSHQRLAGSSSTVARWPSSRAAGPTTRKPQAVNVRSDASWASNTIARARSPSSNSLPPTRPPPP